MLYKNQNSVKIFFEVFSNAMSYSLFIHCHRGKDRTGILAIIDDFTKSPGVERKNSAPLWNEISSLEGTKEYLVHELDISEDLLNAIEQNILKEVP